MNLYGMEAIVRVISHLGFIYLTFHSLQSLRLEAIFRVGDTTRIRMLLTLTALAIGYTVSSFFLDTLALLKNFLLSIF